MLERNPLQQNGILSSAVWTHLPLLFRYVLVSNLLSLRFWTIFPKYLLRCFDKNVIYATAITKWHSEKTMQMVLDSIKQICARMSAWKAGRFFVRQESDTICWSNILLGYSAWDKWQENFRRIEKRSIFKKLPHWTGHSKQPWRASGVVWTHPKPSLNYDGFVWTERYFAVTFLIRRRVNGLLIKSCLANQNHWYR